MVYTISLDGEVVSTGSGTAGSWASDTTSLCLVDGCYEVSVSDAHVVTTVTAGPLWAHQEKQVRGQLFQLVKMAV